MEAYDRVRARGGGGGGHVPGAGRLRGAGAWRLQGRQAGGGGAAAVPGAAAAAGGLPAAHRAQRHQGSIKRIQYRAHTTVICVKYCCL